MRTIIAGSRYGATYEDVRRAVEESGFADQISVVLSGAAMGVDQLGESWAQDRGREIERHPVSEEDWREFGKAAGPMRNRKMAENADALIAIWDGESRGTRNMIFEARNLGLKVYIYRLPRPSAE